MASEGFQCVAGYLLTLRYALLFGSDAKVRVLFSQLEGTRLDFYSVREKKNQIFILLFVLRCIEKNK